MASLRVRSYTLGSYDARVRIAISLWLAWLALVPGLARGYEREDDAVGTTPALGTGVPLEKVPANVTVIDRETLEERADGSFAETLSRELASGAASDGQGSPFNTTFELRGYTASPVLGSPQGIAMYQDGQRINDGFGDLVHWASIPAFAIDRVEVTPGSTAAFGLNALGGAVALRMKDGWSAPGARVTALGKSYGAIGGSAEYGVDLDHFSFYGGVSERHDHGWRDESPSDVTQVFLNAGARGEKLDGGLALTFGLANFTGNGASPIQLVDQDYRAIFTEPDRTDDQLWNLAGRARYALSAETALEGNAYWRHDQLDTKNGDDAEYGPCAEPANAGLLCSDPGDDETVAIEAGGAPLPASDDLSGIVNRTTTRGQGAGMSLQLGDRRDVFGTPNLFHVGSALDLAWTRYKTGSEAGQLGPSREVSGLGFQLGGDELNTKLRSQTRNVGVYVSDVATLTPALAATLAARLNFARVKLHDLAGSDLDGDHGYWHLNPSLGLTYRFSPGLDTYASFGEANRAPTAAELACADPEQPCRVPNAFTADPELDQVVSRTVEVGGRGVAQLPVGSGLSLRWSAAAFAAWNRDDILFVASGPVLGSGYFANAGTTRRLGVELDLRGDWSRGFWFLRYGFVQATFQSRIAIESPFNPAADADGDIHVSPGDRIPNIPEHTLKAGFDYSLAARWRVGADAVYASGRPYQGDESNDLVQVPDFVVVNAETRYELREDLWAVLRLENVFDAKYYSSGVLGDPSEVFPDFADPRFLVPGQPRALALWLTANF